MSEPRTLGVIGTLVWDEILRAEPECDPCEEWGGISYAIVALSASLPQNWRILPIMKLGRDLSGEGISFLDTIPRVDCSQIVLVPEDNNRVQLRYSPDGSRIERLTGGVPGWNWSELDPLVELCDALYVNFISGFEMELETTETLRHEFSGPIYADLHSLFLGMTSDGLRIPTRLKCWEGWFQCFDAVQMNENESKLLCSEETLLDFSIEPSSLIPSLIAVTLGGQGAEYFTTPGFDTPRAKSLYGSREATAPSYSRVALGNDPRVGDPTGCGDVWGATAFARLLAGDELENAIRKANELASENVGQLGAGNLLRYLQGKLSY